MQPERPFLPEFDMFRAHAKAGPVRPAAAPRPAPAYCRANSAKRCFELGAAGERPRLVGGPGADLAVARPAGEIGVGLGGGDRLDLRPRRAPAGPATSSESTAPRAGWRRAPRPCGSRGWYRRRSRARRRPSAARRAPTARRRGSRWRASSPRPASRSSSAELEPARERRERFVLGDLVGHRPNASVAGCALPPCLLLRRAPSATALGRRCPAGGPPGCARRRAGRPASRPHRRRLGLDDAVHRRRHLHLPRHQRPRQPACRRAAGPAPDKGRARSRSRGPRPAPRRRPGWRR